MNLSCGDAIGKRIAGCIGRGVGSVADFGVTAVYIGHLILIDIGLPAAEVAYVHVAVRTAFDIAYLYAGEALRKHLGVTLFVAVGFYNLILIEGEVQRGLPTPVLSNFPVVTEC